MIDFKKLNTEEYRKKRAEQQEKENKILELLPVCCFKKCTSNSEEVVEVNYPEEQETKFFTSCYFHYLNLFSQLKPHVIQRFISDGDIKTINESLTK
jgi:hypothetical protein